MRRARVSCSKSDRALMSGLSPENRNQVVDVRERGRFRHDSLPTRPDPPVALSDALDDWQTAAKSAFRERPNVRFLLEADSQQAAI